MPLAPPARPKAIGPDEVDGKPLRIRFADKACIGQKNTITRRFSIEPMRRGLHGAYVALILRGDPRRFVESPAAFALHCRIK
jgi:hypothetical protein